MGYLLTTAIPDLQRGRAPLGPPVPAQPPLLGLLLPAAGPGLGLGVAPQGHHPWPRARGGFSLLPLTSDAGCLLPAATDLGRGVAPSGRSCAIAAWHSRPRLVRQPAAAACASDFYLSKNLGSSNA